MENNELSHVYVDSAKIECGGASANMDHPKVYLKINTATTSEFSITCPYCNVKYILKS